MRRKEEKKKRRKEEKKEEKERERKKSSKRKRKERQRNSAITFEGKLTSSAFAFIHEATYLVNASCADRVNAAGSD